MIQCFIFILFYDFALDIPFSGNLMHDNTSYYIRNLYSTLYNNIQYLSLPYYAPTMINPEKLSWKAKLLLLFASVKPVTSPINMLLCPIND